MGGLVMVFSTPYSIYLRGTALSMLQLPLLNNRTSKHQAQLSQAIAYIGLHEPSHTLT